MTTIQLHMNRWFEQAPLGLTAKVHSDALGSQGIDERFYSVDKNRMSMELVWR